MKGKRWKCVSTMRSLLSMQAEDGSFTNVLGTVHALPALIGALPYDVADLPCPKGDKGQAEVFAIIVIKLYFIQYGFSILRNMHGA